MCFFCTSELTDMNLIMEVAKRWGYHTFMVWWYNKAAGFFEAVGTSWDLRGFVSARRIFDLELPIYFYITILPPKISLTQWKSFVTFVGPLKHYHWNSYLSTKNRRPWGRPTIELILIFFLIRREWVPLHKLVICYTA